MIAAAILAALEVRADVELSPLFSDHAVLQCDRVVPVWGTADPGERVEVSFHGFSVAALTEATGRWLVLLPAMRADSEGAELEAAGRTRSVARDVVLGEVWLCSGQSNMEFPVDERSQDTGVRMQVLDSDKEIAAADHPLIRQFRVSRSLSGAPAETLSGRWEVCSPRTVPAFSAVGYFFARSLQHRLGAPFGLLSSSYGGTPVESWMSAYALGSNRTFLDIERRWQEMAAEYPARKAAFEGALAEWVRGSAAAAAHGNAALLAYQRGHPRPRGPLDPSGPWRPSSLFNGMIEPLLPYALRGVLWYQGEANADHAPEYHARFEAMIRAWRAHFGQGDLPFLYVQLANFRAPGLPPDAWARLREAQAQTLSLPATGMAVTIDIGEPDNIHPRNKQEVGRRLALIARARVYGIPGDWSGPTFVGSTLVGGSLRVRFEHADNGLTARDRPVQSLEIAGADRVFHPAMGRIEGDTLLVGSQAVPHPIAIRYAWSNAPGANLYNGAGLPAAPFRSDDW